MYYSPVVSPVYPSQFAISGTNSRKQSVNNTLEDAAATKGDFQAVCVVAPLEGPVYRTYPTFVGSVFARFVDRRVVAAEWAK